MNHAGISLCEDDVKEVMLRDDDCVRQFLNFCQTPDRHFVAVTEDGMSFRGTYFPSLAYVERLKLQV